MKKRKLTPKEKSKLIGKLEGEGFRVGSQGHIHVVNPKPTHPLSSTIDPQKNYLPVAFLYEDGIGLVNTDKTFPEDYHNQIKQICESL